MRKVYSKVGLAAVIFVITLAFGATCFTDVNLKNGNVSGALDRGDAESFSDFSPVSISALGCMVGSCLLGLIGFKRRFRPHEDEEGGIDQDNGCSPIREERRDRRFHISGDVLVFLRGGSTPAGTLTDISKRGLAFKCTSGSDIPVGPLTISICVEGESPFKLENLPCELVYERKEVDERGDESRICGVKLGSLSFLQLVHWKRFMSAYADYRMNSMNVNADR